MAGAKLSRKYREMVQQIADHAHTMGAKGPAPDSTPIKADQSLGDQIQAVARAVYRIEDADGYCFIEDVFDGYVVIEVSVQNGSTYWRADYSVSESGAITLAARESWVQVEEAWVPVTASAKGLDPLAEVNAPIYASIKAVGDRVLEVRIAYGGHKQGKDSHNEYFSAKTDFDPENFPAPPLLYYHGFDEQGKKMSRPVVTGKLLKRWNGTDAHYIQYQLKSGKYADLQWAAAQKSECAVSPGTVGHLIRKAGDGHLDYWPLAEVSAWDFAPNRKQANLYSVATPVLKAHYLEAGLTAPSIVDTPPETPGDGVSAVDDEQTKRIIAGAIAEMHLNLRKGTTTP